MAQPKPPVCPTDALSRHGSNAPTSNYSRLSWLHRVRDAVTIRCRDDGHGCREPSRGLIVIQELKHGADADEIRRPVVA